MRQVHLFSLPFPESLINSPGFFGEEEHIVAQCFQVDHAASAFD